MQYEMKIFAPKLHLIQSEDKYYAYIPSSYRIVKLNDLSYKILQHIQAGISIDKICKTYAIRRDEIDTMLRFFLEESSHGISINTSDNKISDNETRIIDRITLHVSNDCNLRCKYCYASGGHYNSDRGLMSKETAETFVDFCFREFQQVRSIVFFGGEPLLNPSVIRYVCRLFEENYKVGNIGYMPKFGAITNGTILSAQALQIIEKYFSFLTISIDGPKDINDANRIDANGNGSFNRIASFIEQVKKIPHLSIQYESTFTDKHTSLGYTHAGIREFMKRRFHLHGDVLEEYSKEKNSNTRVTLMRHSAEDILSGDYPEGFFSILHTVATKTPKTMCQLYRRNFSVSTSGQIFPCHMNTGEERCCLGNISSDNVFTNPDFFLQAHPGIMYGFKNNSICEDCWANNLCGGCSRLWFYNEEESTYTKYPNQNLCKNNCKHIENILAKISDIREDAVLWTRLKNIYRTS